MSKRADNISRFVSGARNLALVQLLVGLTMLGAAAAGTYYIHKEIRADRMTETVEITRIDESPIGESVTKAQYEDVLRRANEYYDAIEERDNIINRQNEQINTGNEALRQNATDLEKLRSDLQACGSVEQTKECPTCEVCPAPVNTQTYVQEINRLKNQVAACDSDPRCAPPTPPCTYDGIPCLDVIASLVSNDANRAENLNATIQKLTDENTSLQAQLNARSQKDCSEEIAIATTGVERKLKTCEQKAEANTCDVNGVPCKEMISSQRQSIEELQKELSTLKERMNGQEVNILEELKKLDPETLQGMLRLLEFNSGD